MATDMKESIAKAAKALLMEKGASKLTVKDIVEKCQITRQAFYYHFEDIPALVRWILAQDTEQAMLEAKALGGGERWLRYLFVMAINTLPYMKKGMKSNYRDELEQILTQHIQRLFEQVCDEKNLYQNCTRFEAKLILRYHSQAIWGASVTLDRGGYPKFGSNRPHCVPIDDRGDLPHGIKPNILRLTRSAECKKFLHSAFSVYTVPLL